MRMVMAGRGMPGAPTYREPSPERGEVIYRYQCALCHGAKGRGIKKADGRGYQFPPLWGPDSYNSGAGLNVIRTGAGFIRANMPPGKPYSLSGQDAMDVSLYLRLQDRPWDPRVGWFSVLMGDLADG
jgi:thiosulfate dehydrogenase